MRIYVGNGKFKTMKMFQKDEIVHTRLRLSLKTNRKPPCKGKSRDLWEMNRGSAIVSGWGYHICTHNIRCKYGNLRKGATASSLEATSLLQYIEHRNGDGT